MSASRRGRLWYNRAMERILRFWFYGALTIAAGFASWLLAGAGLSLFLAVVLVVLVLVTWRHGKPRGRSRKKPWGYPHPLALVVCAACVGGIALSYSSKANEWLENSVMLVDSMVAPVRKYSGDEGKVTISQSELSGIKSRMADLHMGQNGTQTKLLIAFGPTLALLDGNKLTYLTETGTALSAASTFPDGSFVLFSEKRAVRAQRGIPTLSRNIIRNNQMYRIWERKVPGKYLHHWGDAFDGKIYYPGKLFVNLPSPESRAVGYDYGKCDNDNSISDVIYVFDAENADIVETIPLLPAIIELKKRDDTLAKDISQCDDPLHLNDVQILKNEREAGYFPGGKVGDMLLSFRDISTVFLLDKDTHTIKWYVQGSFSHQHSPRISGWGTIILYDNRGGDEPNGRTRIVEVDIATRKVVGWWEATGNDVFNGWIKGKVYIVGKQILVGEQETGKRGERIFSLTCPSFPMSNACKKTLVLEGVKFDNFIPLRPPSP